MAFSSAELATIARLGNYANSQFANDQHRSNFIPALDDVATASRAIGREASAVQAAVVAMNAISIDGMVTGSQVGALVAAAEARVSAESPMVNMIADGGRFSDGVPRDLTAGSFVAPPFLVPFNGASPLVSAGKFIDNNADFGGSGGALPPVVRALIDFTGKTQQRGQEFYVAQTTAGTGTLIQMGSTGHYLLTVNGNAALPYSATISFFLRAKSGSVAIEREHHRNGAPVPGSAILPGNGWYHIRQSFVSTNGFDNARPRIYATPGAEVQIALLAVVSGLLAHPEHDRAIPIPSTLWRF